MPAVRDLIAGVLAIDPSANAVEAPGETTVAWDADAVRGARGVLAIAWAIPFGSNATSPAWEDRRTLVYATDCGRGYGLNAVARIVLDE